jgi:hypothetical protein
MDAPKSLNPTFSYLLVLKLLYKLDSITIPLIICDSFDTLRLHVDYLERAHQPSYPSQFSY